MKHKIVLLWIFSALPLAAVEPLPTQSEKNVVELIHQWNGMIKRGETEALAKEWSGANSLLIDFDVPEKPLIVAVRAGRVEIVKMMLDLDADVNIRDASGFTPLHHAMTSGAPEIVDLLVESEADVFALSHSYSTVASMTRATPEAIKKLAGHLRKLGSLKKFWDWKVAVFRTHFTNMTQERQIEKLQELVPEWRAQGDSR